MVEGILAADNIGLEAGSKPELLAIMALSNQGVVVCNGYKDRAYIRLALIGLKMGLNLYLVIEKPLELELIIEEAARLNIKPQLGCEGSAFQHQCRKMAKQRRRKIQIRSSCL